MTCPDHDLLVDYVDQLVPAAGAVRIERHLVVCQSCRATVDAERELLGRLRGVAEPGNQEQFLASLRQVGEWEAASPARPGPSAPSTLPENAPAQYVSARRSLSLAALAVVASFGLAGAVVSHAQRTEPIVPPRQADPAGFSAVVVPGAAAVEAPRFQVSTILQTGR